MGNDPVAVFWGVVSLVAFIAAATYLQVFP
jgi:hypothetical protein